MYPIMIDHRPTGKENNSKARSEKSDQKRLSVINASGEKSASSRCVCALSAFISSSTALVVSARAKCRSLVNYICILCKDACRTGEKETLDLFKIRLCFVFRKSACFRRDISQILYMQQKNKQITPPSPSSRKYQARSFSTQVKDNELRLQRNFNFLNSMQIKSKGLFRMI